MLLMSDKRGEAAPGNSQDEDEKLDQDDPVSLAPLTPEQALRGLLAVKPDKDEDAP